MLRKSIHVLGIFLCVFVSVVRETQAAGGPDFDQHIAPLLNKYCVGCHNADESNGKLDMSSFASLLKGGEHGLVLTPGSIASSRMLNMILGKQAPIMPPEDQARPTPEEIELLAKWIELGAGGPQGQSFSVSLRVPFLKPSRLPSPIVSLDISPDGSRLAVGGYQQIELLDGMGQVLLGTLGEHPGKVNDVRFSLDGQFLLAATGVTGLHGEAWLWDLAQGVKVATFGGHRDVLYTAALSDDGRFVATAGYDRVILIHDRTTGEVKHRLAEHNGAVFDLSFSPDSQVLISASSDATVKVWNVATGERLDTRGEALKEQLTTAIHPSGKWFVAAGGDNRIRMWQLLSRDHSAINPSVFSRFAHEGAVERLRYSRDGRILASVARDRTVKVWDAERLEEVAFLPSQTSPAQTLAVDPQGKYVVVGRMDGTLESYPIDAQPMTSTSAPTITAHPIPTTASSAVMQELQEQEPNRELEQAQVLSLPVSVRGTIDREMDTPDQADTFAIDCQAGEKWILEVVASRQQSRLDSYIEILDNQGKPVPRVLLQAMRDSYFTFRGKDSIQTGDFRLHNWEEMRMNQLLYCNGEVVRLWHYPRGPDSGFVVFPNEGSRHTMFDTTAITHPLGEVCYIVEPHAPGSRLIPNGLPVFTIPFANDDDGEREVGTDSRLTFDVPRDGRYWIRVRDTRQFQGPDYSYQLLVRPPDPRFAIKGVDGENPEMSQGDGTKFGVLVDRIDGFMGPIRVDVTQVPPGFHVTSPLIVEAGQLRAAGRIWSDVDAKAPDETTPPLQLVASSDWGGTPIQLTPQSLGRPKLRAPAKIAVRVAPADQLASASGGITETRGASPNTWPVLEMRPGSTATVVIKIERREFNDRVQFGGFDGAINAPFGVYVDNIGLNGILIPEQETERTVFIRADAVTAPGETVIFFSTSDGGGATSNPLHLKIIDPAPSVAKE